MLALVKCTASLREQEPVPIIRRSVGNFFADISIMARRCSIVNELASPVLPSNATPSDPDSSSHCTWRTNAGKFGSYDLLSGVKEAV
jgi:hypothetical protein